MTSTLPPLPLSDTELRGRAAILLAQSPEEVQRFAVDGLIDLAGIELQVVEWQPPPVRDWLVIAMVAQPDGVSDVVWHTGLLYANLTTMASSSISTGLSESGHAIVMLRLPPGLDAAEPLAEGLNVLAFTVMLLRDCAVALQARVSAGEPAPLPEPPPMPPPSAELLEAVEQAKVTDWHRALITDAMSALLGHPVAPPEVVGADTLSIGGQPIDVLAHCDGHTLLLGGSLGESLDAPSLRLALQANTELVPMAGCAVALGPAGPLLQMRCDTEGLDGEALAEQFAGFAQIVAEAKAHRLAATPA